MGAWSFAVLGDSRDDSESAFPAIAAQIHHDPEFAFTIHLGDMVPSGGEAQLKDFLRVAEPLRDCLFPVVGNHEVGRDPGRGAFKTALGLKNTSYSFNYRNAHFAVIDNASQEFSPGVLEWLRADLAKNKKGTAGIELVEHLDLPRQAWFPPRFDTSDHRAMPPGARGSPNLVSGPH